MCEPLQVIRFEIALMKMRILIFVIITLISCNQNQNNKQKQHAESVIEKTKAANDNSSQPEKVFKFDNSVIPDKLIQFIETKFDSLRIPVENDYEIEYFKSEERVSIPYFCSGYFNNDTLIDYAIVLVKDSTEHFVFSFNSNKDNFEYFKLCESPFLSEYNSDRIYAVFDLETDTERVLEGIDTTYKVSTDLITISNIYESLTFSHVWNEKKRKYDELVFD